MGIEKKSAAVNRLLPEFKTVGLCRQYGYSARLGPLGKILNVLCPVLFPVLFVLLLCSIPAGAKLAADKPIHQFGFQNWQEAQGLLQDSVLSIAQTPDGYLWVGTEEGVARFDGIRFTGFNAQDSGLSNNYVEALLVDHSGRLWAGTHDGLNVLNGARFSVYDHKAGLPAYPIKALFEDSRKHLWIGTEGGGLVRMTDGKMTIFNKAKGLIDNSVFSITEDNHGTLWVGTHNGLSRLSPTGDITNFDVGTGLSSNYVRVVKADRQGNLWVGTKEGLNRISPAGISQFNIKDGLKSKEVYSLVEDQSGTIWIGTEAGGLSRLVDGKISSYLDDAGLLGVPLWSLFEDHEGNLWVGTTGHGLICFKQGLFTNFTVKDGLPSNTVLAVLEDRSGSLWIGSDQGLIQKTKDQVALFTKAQGLPDNLILSLTQDQTGAIWVGTRHGLAQVVNGKVLPFQAESQLPSEFILCTYTDSAGNVWIGSKKGLSFFDGRKLTTFTSEDGLSSGSVLCVTQDQKGTIWIGTSAGLSLFRNGRFHTYTKQDGLSGNTVFDVHRDADGVLWLATDHGLSRLDNEKITNLAASDQMYSGAIFYIAEDAGKHLWLTTNKGVFRLGRDELNRFAEGGIGTIAATYYDKSDGMASRECNGGFQPAGWQGKQGRLYFPTTGGLAFVDPGVLANGVWPHTVLEQSTVDAHSYAVTKPITAPPGKGLLEFRFTAPSFVAPERLRFRYMLEGFDKDWIEAGDRRTAYYTNIPHGSYRFLVQVGDDNGWKSRFGTATIQLQPHFYETTVFYFLVAAAVVGFCGGAYRIRINQAIQREQELKILVDQRTSALRESERQLRRSRDELEIRVQERTQELTEANQSLGEEIETRRRTEEQLILAKDAAEAANRAKSDFLTNMSHELRTPINGILGMTDITLSTDLDGEQKEYLAIVKQSADSLLAIVDDILDFSIIEERKLQLDHTPFQLRATVNELCRSLETRAAEKNLSFTWEIRHDVPDTLTGDPVRLRQVLMNLLDNAVKFTAQGNIALHVFPQQPADKPAAIHFTVRDTGIGISPDKQKVIFEAFSQADYSSTRRYGGTGLGLTISHHLAVLMGGNLWVESALGQGSAFHFTAEFEIDPGSANPEPAQMLTEVGISLA